MAKALMYAEDGITIADRCRGASWTGGCPRSVPNSPVDCAGRRIVALAAGWARGLVLLVEPDAVVCPLAVLNVFRESSASGSPVGRKRAA